MESKTTPAVPNCRWCVDNGLVGDPLLAQNGSHYMIAKTDRARPAAMVIPFRHVETPFDLTPDE